MEEYIGVIKLFAGNYEPQYFMFCHGQSLSIAQNQALFAIIGTTYGGDGRTTFKLPDLRGRVPVGVGAGPGLPNYIQGQAGGVPTITLTPANLPAHSHAAGAITVNVANAGSVDVPVNTTVGSGDSTNPTGILSANGGGEPFTSDPANGKYSGGSLPVKGAQVTATAAATAIAGQSQPVDIRTPYLGLNYIICVQGIFPPRSY
jgi:microcystin-dependent protein